MFSCPRVFDYKPLFFESNKDVFGLWLPCPCLQQAVVNCSSVSRLFACIIAAAHEKYPLLGSACTNNLGTDRQVVWLGPFGCTVIIMDVLTDMRKLTLLLVQVTI